MALAATEFIRRVLLHVLPTGFHRIRYYGLLAHRRRQANLTQVRLLLGTPPPPAEDRNIASTDYRDRYQALTGRSLRQCPRCDDGEMRVVDCLAGRAHPAILDTS